MSIDFDKTREAIRAHPTGGDQGREHQIAGVMLGVCDDVMAGRYRFEEDADDAVGRGFVGWTRARGLLVTA